MEGLLTMTDGSGILMRNSYGDLYTHQLGKGENPASMACVLTKQVRASGTATARCRGRSGSRFNILLQGGDDD